MNYWLVKSEPEDYSFDQLIKEGATTWNGIRNYQARNNLRAMKTDDLVLFYHSRTGLEIVGLAKVAREAYPDPTAMRGDWSAVDLEPVLPFQAPVSLKTIKDTPEFSDIALVRNSRLSVMPIPEEAFKLILEMSKTELHY